MDEDKTRKTSIGDLVTLASQLFGDRIAFQKDDRKLTFAELETRVDQFADGLNELNVRQGDKIAIMARNSMEFICTLLGTTRLGAIYVPINTDYRGEILKYQLGKADVSHILIDEEFLERLEHVISDLPKLKHVIVKGPKPSRIGGANVHAAEQLLSGGARGAQVTVRHSDPMTIMYTSGTTGPSKGVLASHAHVLTFALDYMRCTNFKDGNSIYACTPFFHALSSWLGVVPVILAGGRLAFAEKFSASRFWDDVRRYDVSHVNGIFSMIPILLKQPAKPSDAEQPARTWYIGQQNEAFERRFNIRVVEVFGLTETGVNTMTPYDQERRPNSCGRANSEYYEVAIVDDDDEPVPPGAVGEIVVRSKKPYCLMSEYYNAPEATLSAFRNLWLHTGDNGRMDEDGYFYFVDRKKDSIRRRGENISSYEVETVVNGHEGVLECAAVPVPSELGEDDVKVVVVPKPGVDLTAKELWLYCEAEMPPFWIPRFIEFIDELPKTPTQKIEKYRLRQMDGIKLFDRDRHKAPAV